MTDTFTNLKVITYGYDYPRPLLNGGKYIGRYLREKKIPDKLMSPIMKEALIRFNQVVEQVAKEYDSVFYLNCLGVTEAFTWSNDMHPGNDGFRALSQKFESAMANLQ